MTKRTIENLIDKIVLGKLKKNYYLHASEIVEDFEKLCETSEDLEEIIDIFSNSKNYNYILLQNGEGYFVSFDKQDFRMFFEDIGISTNDPVWHEHFTLRSTSHTLLDIFLDLEGVR